MTKDNLKDVKKLEEEIRKHIQKAIAFSDREYLQEVAKELIDIEAHVNEWTETVLRRGIDSPEKFYNLVKFMWLSFYLSLLAGLMLLQIESKDSIKQGIDVLLRAERYLLILEGLLYDDKRRHLRLSDEFKSVARTIYRPMVTKLIRVSGADRSFIKKILEGIKMGNFKGVFGYYKGAVCLSIGIFYLLMSEEYEKGQEYCEKASKAYEDLAKATNDDRRLVLSQRILQSAPEFALESERVRRTPLGHLYDEFIRLASPVSTDSAETKSPTQVAVLHFLSSGPKTTKEFNKEFEKSGYSIGAIRMARTRLVNKKLVKKKLIKIESIKRCDGTTIPKTTYRYSLVTYQSSKLMELVSNLLEGADITS